MAKIRNILYLLTSLCLLLPAAALASGGPSGPNVVIVADTRKLTGILAWWGGLYNESHLYFTILTVILIPLIGVIFGTLADFLMHFVGIDLKSRELAEH